LGGSQGFCVQCGRELKLPTQFCTACGHAVGGAGQAGRAPVGGQGVPGREREITATMTPPRTGEPVRRKPVAAEPSWSAQYAPQAPPPVPPPLPRNVPVPTAPGPHPPPPPRRARRWWPLVFPAAAVLAAGITALYLVVLRPSHGPQPGPSGSSSTSPTSTPPTTSAPPSPTPTPAEQQAAISLAALLGQSNADRNATVSAANDVSNCGPDLSQDQQALENSATSRMQLLSKLASLPGRSALPAQMLQDLTNAWKESVTADQDLAAWAQDKSSQGCGLDDQSDPHYQAASGPDNQAKADKMAFVGAWNAIASEYALPSYKWDQI
jgi:hypothetical protein